jgi:hypothetical protein
MTRRSGDMPAPGAARAASGPGLAVPAALGIALGVSPFASGYYDSSIWAPAGLGLLIVLTAALIAGPIGLPRRAVVAPAAIAMLALLALASALWTDSIEQAFVDGNRTLIYAAGLSLLVVLLRSDRGAVLAFGAFVAGAVAVGGWVLAGMLGGDESLFLGGRLHEPLGYINGQASFFVLAFWPCLALAELRRGAAGTTVPALGGGVGPTLPPGRGGAIGSPALAGLGWRARRSSRGWPCSANHAARCWRPRCRCSSCSRCYRGACGASSRCSSARSASRPRCRRCSTSTALARPAPSWAARRGRCCWRPSPQAPSGPRSWPSSSARR